MHIGMSTQRLESSDMLEMDEIRNYSHLLCKSLDRFSIMDESEISRIVVLQNTERFTESGLKDMRSHLYNDKDSCQIE